jgi:peptide-methionine (R)-S-oxide reductase
MFKSRARAGAAGAAQLQKPDGQWRSELTPLQYKVLRQGRTEPAFAGGCLEDNRDGVYRCAGCRSELFRSGARFESATGWPSFSEPALAAAVVLRPDRGLLLRRTEVRCRQCGGHLGHVFGDGPTATGDRYCINSCVLLFEPVGPVEAAGAEGAGPAQPVEPVEPAGAEPGSPGQRPR